MSETPNIFEYDTFKAIQTTKELSSSTEVKSGIKSNCARISRHPIIAQCIMPGFEFLT